MKLLILISRTLCAVLLLTVFAVNDTSAQKLKPGPQDLSFFSSVDDTDQPYAIYIPENFDESKSWPLVVFLHGAWSNHRLGLRHPSDHENFAVGRPYQRLKSDF